MFKYKYFCEDSHILRTRELGDGTIQRKFGVLDGTGIDLFEDSRDRGLYCCIKKKEITEEHRGTHWVF